MENLGNVMSLTAVLAGVFASVWALVMALALVSPDKAAAAAEQAVLHPKRRAALGLVVGVLPGLIGLALMSAPTPGGRLLGICLVTGVMAVTALGLAGLALHASHRIRSLESQVSPLGALGRAAAILLGACFVPIVGWFLAAPALLSLAFGSALVGLQARPEADPAA